MNESPQLVQLQSAAHDELVRSQRWAHLRPQSALVYLENRCNLKCEHCYESEDTHPPARYMMSLSDYQKLFEDLADIGVLEVHFTGGEIFLRRDLLEIVAEARRQRFAVTLFTSGTLIDEQKAQRLAELNVHRVEISLYSHNAEVHDRFTRIPGSHRRSIRALELLARYGVRTVLKANLMTFNIEHIDDLIDLAKRLGADCQLDPTVKPRMNGDKTPLEFAVSPDRLRKLVLNRPDLYTAFQKYQPGDLCSGTSALLDPDDVLCVAAREAVSISADGGVYGCGFFPTAGGHLRKQSFKSIWYGSEQFDRIRQTTFGKMTACSSCDVKSTCNPCMAYAEVEHNDHTECNSSSRQLADALRLLAERKLKTDAKLSRGRSLPIVGSKNVPRPRTEGRLVTE